MSIYKLEKPIKVYKYKAVPENERHSDYQVGGVAPIIGHYLSEIANEDSNRGALAEGILRTGNHNLLPILNDKLAGDDFTDPHQYHAEYDNDFNKVKGPIDWYHAPRAIAIDKAVNKLLGPQTFHHPEAGYVHYSEISPSEVLSAYQQGLNPTGLGRTAIRSNLKRYIKDINKEDVLHSLIRLSLNKFGIHPTEAVRELGSNLILKSLKSKLPNAHEYVDTRKKGKKGPVYYSLEDNNLIQLPDIRQEDNYSCEAACAMAVGLYFNVGPKSLEEWKKQLDVTSTHPINFTKVAEYFIKCGLEAKLQDNMTLNDLANEVECGHPVICLIQEYGVPTKQASAEYGHVVVVVGLGNGQVFVSDPSIDNVLEGQDSKQTPGLSVIDYADWLKVWDAKDSQNQRHIRLGLCVGDSKIKYAKKSQSWVGHKIGILMDEGYPHKQAIAIALSMAGRSRKKKKAKYAITKAGSKGMVDQISPLAAFGAWRQPGEFSTTLKAAKAPVMNEFTTSTQKNKPPISRYDSNKLAIDYIRKISAFLKKKLKKK